MNQALENELRKLAYERSRSGETVLDRAIMFNKEFDRLNRIFKGGKYAKVLRPE